MATKKIKFTKSPTGAFKLAYSINDVAELNDELADVLIESKFAVVADDAPAKPKATKKPKASQGNG